MATVSEDVIAEYPIKDRLGRFRRSFEPICADLDVAVTSDAVQVVFSTVDPEG